MRTVARNPIGGNRMESLECFCKLFERGEVHDTISIGRTYLRDATVKCGVRI